METIKEAKAFLAKNLQEGCTCPVCSKLAKAHKRNINSAVAAVLVSFYKKTIELSPLDGWLHIGKDVFDTGTYNGEYAKLKYWGFLEQKLKPRKGGLWRITEKGKQFVEGAITVPKFIWTYNNQFLAADPRELVSIDDVLGDKLACGETMGEKS